MPTRGRRPRAPHRQASRGALASSPGGGLRPASRVSAKPAPMTQRHANPRPKATRPPPPGEQKERRSPTGIARERETSPDDAASCQPEAEGRETPIARRAEGAPVSDRHRAGARNQPRRRGVMPNTRPKAARLASPGEPWSAGQFSRWGPPTGIARERETSPDDAALCPCVCHPPLQSRKPDAPDRRHGPVR